MPDMMQGQHMAPENLKMNPIHSMPWLGAYKNGTVEGINDSLAIVEYLCMKYAGNVPDSFMGGSNPLKKAKHLEKANILKDTLYRATMYQYVYPMFFGLMTECQYDLCKRDFCLEIVEEWCKDGIYLGAAEPSISDFYLVSLHMGMMWNHKPEFKRKWEWEKVLPSKYPNMWKVINKMLAVPAVKEVHEANPSEKICGANTWADMVAPMVGQKEMPGEGREFVYDHPKGMVHPNLISMSDHGKDFVKPITK